MIYIKTILITCLFLLFSCTNVGGNNENIKQNNQTESNIVNNYDFYFICMDNEDRTSILKKSLFLKMKKNNYLLHIENLKECNKNITIEDYDSYDIPVTSLTATKYFNEVYFLSLDVNSLDFIVNKGTSYKKEMAVNYLEFKRFTFDETGNILDKTKR